ncbi:hypothetical protein CDAR_108972 [Caerostris darwini]|uniref:Uncharacterized protein n=1 Tax=Caerostris darwini TaxID=1538125 RepID=A0AAV4QPZ2_9ARAC|nr:hypothetical protein CDAR_108972 [Caerostris darwini]
MSSSRQSRTSRSLSPPKGKEISKEQDQHTCDRCHKRSRKEDEKKILPSMTDKSQQTRIGYDKSQEHTQWRYGGNGRRPSSRQSCVPTDGSSRNTRQANLVCTKHEKEKVKMQATIEKLQEAFCDKESKFQDTKSQLVRERRMSEIMERQLKNARNLSEQLGRIINDREQEIRTLKNLLNKRQDSKNASETAVQAAMLKASRQSDRRRSSSKDDFQASMRRNQ